MIKVGDTVKVIGTTVCGLEEKECIKIGTICKVVGIEVDEKEGLIVGMIPERELPYNGYGEYWYLEKDVEKGHMEWIKD
ncbi:MAG: hypothetical protein IKY26_09290 [Erysipelotrichaceae bacterium]|nr:hypothetical protein [Erysipelotrichaceae bacterium]